MVAKMQSVSPHKDESQFHYLPVDITIMADVKRFTSECILLVLLSYLCFPSFYLFFTRGCRYA